MSIEIRPCLSVEEVRDALNAISHYFGHVNDLESTDRFTERMDIDRVHAAWDGDRIVGGAGAFTYRMSIPGGAIPTAGVTIVGVLPTHRRRGVLTALMRDQLADCRARGESAAYLWAQLLYCLAAILHAGIVNQPTAYEGNNYLLPTVAAVVLGGTSLLGGRGNVVATAIAALFLSQLDQFVLALGVSYATRTLVQAAALAAGVALYTVNWRALTRRVTRRRPSTVAPT